MHRKGRCIKTLAEQTKCQKCGGNVVSPLNDIFVFDYCLSTPECAKELIVKQILPFSRKKTDIIKEKMTKSMISNET